MNSATIGVGVNIAQEPIHSPYQKSYAESGFAPLKVAVETHVVGVNPFNLYS